MTRLCFCVVITHLYVHTGGAAGLAVRFPDLWKKGFLHLWPLYQIDKDAAGLPKEYTGVSVSVSVSESESVSVSDSVSVSMPVSMSVCLCATLRD